MQIWGQLAQRTAAEKFEQFFDLYAAKKSAYSQLFVDNRCPIFVASTWLNTEYGRIHEFKVVFNDCLRELNSSG